MWMIVTRENDDENDDDADVSWFSTFDYRRIVITLGSRTALPIRKAPACLVT